jgi:hypothetical protein
VPYDAKLKESTLKENDFFKWAVASFHYYCQSLQDLKIVFLKKMAKPYQLTPIEITM